MTYIYKLKIAGKSYVGSTKHIKDRILHHSFLVNYENIHYYNLKLYKFIRENGGWDNVEIHILQECNEDVRYIIEDFYINHYKCELNMCSAKRDSKKYKEYADKWYVDNKYRLKKVRQKYYVNNKEKINEKNNQYYKKNNVNKYNCLCGGRYSNHSKNKHFKTLKHKNYLASLSSSDASSSFQSTGLK